MTARWLVAREIAAMMDGWAHCYCSGGGSYFIETPHKMGRKMRWSWVIIVFLYCLIFWIWKYRKHKNCKQYQQSCVVGIWHTSVIWLRHDFQKCCQMWHNFWDFNFKPILMHHKNTIRLSFPTKSNLTLGTVINQDNARVTRTLQHWQRPNLNIQ